MCVFQCVFGRFSLRIRLLALLFLVLACIHPVVGQSLGLGNRKDSSSPPPSTSDPLGRTTPRGTITAFIRSVHRDDYVSAARYMQVGPKQRANVEVLARDLKELMDRYFGQALTSISDVPSGSLDDGLPLDRERVGPLAMRNGSSEIILVRVNDLDVGPIWLISSETLSQCPRSTMRLNNPGSSASRRRRSSNTLYLGCRWHCGWAGSLPSRFRASHC